MKLRYFFPMVLPFAILSFLGEELKSTGAEDSGVDCFRCHNRNNLLSVKSDEGKGLREFFIEKGEGVIPTYDPILMKDIYLFRFPKRGRHEEGELADKSLCGKCHRVEAYGINHQKVSYRKPESGFEPVDCASGCHIWFGSTVETKGLGGKTYKGTLNPFALLNASKDKHSEIFFKGYARDGNETLKVREISKGCLGCHSLVGKNHGSVPTCLDCHTFSGAGKEIHRMHINIAGGENSCSYCHFQEGEESKFRPACYNCHLSAHSVRSKHLW